MATLGERLSTLAGSMRYVAGGAEAVRVMSAEGDYALVRLSDGSTRTVKLCNLYTEPFAALKAGYEL